MWLWFTVLFANFSEAIAEGRGKAQADALRKTRKDTQARKILSLPENGGKPDKFELIASSQLRQDDLFYVESGEIIPADGEVVEGIASVDESAVTGESAPVIRESGGDRSASDGGNPIAFRLDGCKSYLKPRRGLFRSNDQPRGRGKTGENP